MTSKRKRLKKLAQSFGVQRNDFNKWLSDLGYNSSDSYSKLIKISRVRILNYRNHIEQNKLYYENLEKALANLNIQLYNSDSSIRHIREVFEDLSKAWKESITNEV